MQRDEVAFSRKRAHFHIFNAILSGPFLVRIRVGSQDTHPKSAQDFAHNAHGLASAKNAGRFSSQVKSHQAAK